MPLFDPLSRYRADSSPVQSLDLVAGAAGVVAVSGLSSVADGSVAIDLGSNVFRFYGANFSGANQLFISENGLISFGGAEPSGSNNNLFGYEAYRIAPLWDDWVTNRNTSSDDLVLYQFRDLNSDGVADQLVIEWNNVYNNSVPESDGATFQVILSLNTDVSNGDIVFNYVDVTVDGDSGDGNFNNGGNATIGIRSGQPGTAWSPLLVSIDGQQYNAYSQLVPSTLPVTSGSAIRISAVPNPSSPAPALVKDINTQRIGSNPSQLRVLNGALYVAGDNGFSGRGELLRIDASGASSLVRDVRVGPNGADIRALTVVGSSLFFFAYDDTNGYGLWKSDGTNAGTTLVKGTLSSYTYSYNDATTVAAIGGKFFFRGYDDTNGLELWVSDGTAAGTLRISNIEADGGSSNPYNLTDVNGTLFFCATTSTGGIELYKTGGTAATTVLIRDIAIGAPGSEPRELLNLNGTLYFTANDGISGRELWNSDGTSAGTVTVRNINPTAGQGSDPLNLTILGTSLYFFANSGNGYQLWKSDGTSAGTVAVSATVFYADYWSNNSFNLTNINGTLYFSHQGATTTELWKSNGSTVTKVANLPSYYSFISGFTNVGGVLYFNLGDNDASTGRELWKSDGTAAGTMLVRDVVPGRSGSNPRELTVFNNKLYFVAASDNFYNNDELWSSDGTAAGTVSMELEPVTVGADISNPVLFNGKLYFAADDGVLGKELWTSDGTAAGTQLIKDVRAGESEGGIKSLTAMGSNLYFFAYDDTNGYGLWKSNGSGAGTSLVMALDSWSYSYSPIIAAGNRIYFAANSVAGVELWSSNGTASGTALVRNISPGFASSDPGLWKQAVIGNTMFFTAYDPVNGRELWKTNGTTAGTSLVRNINPGAGDSNPDDLIVFNGALYFDAYDPTYGRELWKTDGTTTSRVKNIHAGSSNSDPQSYSVFQGNLYFSANDGSGWQLWKTDGSTAGTVKVTTFSYWYQPPAQLTAVNNTLYFTVNGQDLWKTDGTTAGTTMMNGAAWANLGSNAALSDLTNVNGVLYFAATDASNGRELWRSDGTEEGTFRVTDLNPQAPLGSGLGNANPSNLIYDANRNKLFFTASNWQSGGEYYGNNELFSLDVSPVSSTPSITLTLSPATVAEDGTSNLVYTFTRTGATTSALTVNYTLGGSAILGADFTGIAATPATKTVTFLEGSATATVTVDPTADSEVEQAETVELTLVAGSGYTIGTTATVTGIIRNDDTRPVFDPLSRYRAESTAYQAIDLTAGAAGVVSISGLSSVADGSVAINLGSNVFRFYGVNFSGANQLFISENGLISFGGAEPSGSNNNLFGYEAYRIAPLWDDWVTNRNTSTNDLVLYQLRDLNSDGVADQLVIEWNNVYNNSVPESDGATFQVILSLNTGVSNGDIVFNYVDVTVDGDSGDGNFNNGGNATIGIRSGQPGTAWSPLLVSVDGQQYNAYSQAYSQLVPSTLPVTSGSAIRISTVPNPSSPAPALVKDINTQRIGSNPSQLRVFNGALYVAGNNGFSGSGELLRVDATGNSSLVRDVRVGPNGSGIRALTVVGSSLFFLADDDTNGYGLWKSDGTNAGTTLVRGVLSSYTRDYNDATTVAASGGKFFFRGYDDTNGLELWVSDGTAAGTLRISNIEAGGGWSSPYNLTDVNGTLFFCATTSTGGTELYKSGGTAATTVLVRDIASGAPGSDPRELLNLNGTLYFTANDGISGRELWKSGGTSATTAVVRNINATATAGSDPLNLTILGTTIYFFANSGNGYQLWKSDGTSAGTVIVDSNTFYADTYSNNNFNLFNLNGTLYFSNQGETTTELWKSDGSSVSKVADLPSYSSYISGFTNLNGVLYFNLSDGVANIGSELWKSDGTTAGTMLVRDVVPGPASSNPRELTAFNNKLYFVAATDNFYSNNDELWSTDGTAAGTESMELHPVTVGADISNPMLFNGKLYFAANDGVLGKELWTSDGTAAGTQLVKDVRAGANGGGIQALTAMGANLYFFAYDDTNGHGLWKSDGSAAGTSFIAALDGWSYNYSPIIAAGNRIYFAAYSVAGVELWSSNGTASGTALVRNINPGAASADPWLWKQAVIGDTFFFTASNPINGRELWKTNGTTAGTSLVRNINPGAGDSTPDDLIVFNGALYFDAYDPTYGRELWKTDGTTTSRVKNIHAGSSSSDPQSYAIFQGNLYFSAYDGSSWQLWKTDGSTAGTVKVTNFHNSWSQPAQLTAVDNTLFFTVDGQDLWKTDGTTTGTSMMSGAPWANLGSNAALSELTNVNGVLYFAASDVTNGRELWRSDGTAEGTFRVTDLNPQALLGNGLGNANPSNLIYDASRSKLFFTASNWQSGGENYGNNELFSLDVNNTPTDININASTLDENVVASTVVSGFSTTDLDVGNTFAYGLVAGTGDTDNNAFTIANSQLRINTSPNFENKNNYSIRVRTTDQSGGSFEKSFTIAVNDLNEAPADLTLGATSINENVPAGTVVGNFSSADQDAGNTFSYSLVAGSGATNNGAFTIDGNQLQINPSPDFETINTYNIRVRTTDQGGLTFEKSLTIAVNNLNEAPTDLAFTGSGNVNENAGPALVLGSLSTIDPDSPTTPQTFTYSLVSGSGDGDNAAFSVIGNQLVLKASADFETKNSYSLRLRSTDQGGLFTDKVVSIAVNNLNEAPTDLGLNVSSVNENVAANTVVGSFSSVDQDAGNIFTYSLVTGLGATDNASFNIFGNQLRISNSPNFETKNTFSIRVRSTDQSGAFVEKVVPISILNVNETPINTSLSASSVNENIAAGSLVGTLSSTDPDSPLTPQSFSYRLVSGTGSTDNAAFELMENELRLRSVPDFELKSSYSIRLQSRDQGNLSFAKVFTITVNNLPEAPTDLALSATSFNENLVAGSVVGSFSTTDPDTANSFTYSLVAGSGATDNSGFTISGNQLQINGSPDFETTNSYSIRVCSTDQGGLSVEKAITLTVNNLNEAPSDLTLNGSPSSTLTVNENAGSALVLGSLSSIDPDSPATPQSVSYSLVSGTGDTDNAAFSVIGNQLLLNAPADFEIRNSYSLRLRGTDQGGLFTEKIFTVNVNNLNEAPTDLALSASSLNENVAANTPIGSFTTTDPDSGNSFTYSLVGGSGATDNSAFSVVGNQLRINNSPNFESKRSFSIRVRSTDQNGSFLEKVVPISILNVNETPTNISLSATNVNENVAAGSLVGLLNSTDPDSPLTPQSFSYRLVNGTSSTDNAAFELVENELRLRSVPDFELKSSYSIRLQSRDQGSLSFAKVFTITVNNLPEAPTDLALSATSLDENLATGSVVGSFSTTDPDTANTFTYSLAPGNGASDNSSFTINGNQLQINSSPDFETKNSYSIRVRSTDQGGLSVEKAITLTVNNLNEAPSDLTLNGSPSSTLTVNENAGPALLLGSLSSIDPDSPATSQSVSYSLVSGPDETDNAAFSVIGNQLLLNTSADFETKSSYSLRLRGTDQGGLFTEKIYTVNVNNRNDAPTDVSLARASIDENTAPGWGISWFQVADQDEGDSFTISLVPGSGDADNSSFSISDNLLRNTFTPDFESKSSYSIRLRVTDQSGAFVDKAQIVSINNVNEVVGSGGSDTLMASEMKDSIDGLAGNDVFQVNLSALTVGDVLVGGNDVDRINFSGGSSSQLLSINLGSVNQLVELSNPGISGDSPLLSQFEQVSLASFAGRGILIGDLQNNLLIGSAQKDTLTGNAGADTFGLASLSHSLLTRFDVITDYTSQDRIDSPTPAFTLSSSSGNATALTGPAIAAVLSNGVFPANSARAFTVTNQPGVFLALNNGIAGFNSGADALLHLSNHSLNAANPLTVL